MHTENRAPPRGERATEPALLLRVEFKLIEGLVARVENGRLVGERSTRAPVGVLVPDDIDMAADFRRLNGILNSRGAVGIVPVFDNQAGGLQPDGPRAGQPDLRLYFAALFRSTKPDSLSATARELTALSIVDTAYWAPPSETPGGMGLPNK
jgi:hypothetical protein